MKKTTSAVWRFFDRIEENGRFVTAVCKLCDKQYKYCGNTTSFRCHLLNKHPIQWELGQNGSPEEGLHVTATDDETNQATLRPRQKIYRKTTHSNDNVDVLESETDIEQHDNDTQATINLVRQMQRGSDEEWLNEEVFDTVETYTQPQKKRKIYRKIKREVATPSPITSREPKKHTLMNNIKDEYQAFGDYVSNKLKKLQNQQSRSNVQQLITTILWQAEYGMYDNIDTVKRILLHSMQDTVPSVQEEVDIRNISVETTSGPTAD